MTETLRQQETAPASYPDEPVTADGDLQVVAWQRIEHYIAWRFSPRAVVWFVQSDGEEWHPPLVPVVTIAAQFGDGEPTEPPAGPTGGYLLPDGTVKVTATVGAGPVPEAVGEAVARFIKFLAETKLHPSRTKSLSVGSLSMGFGNAPGIIDSGAGDLLRPWRTP